MRLLKPLLVLGLAAVLGISVVMSRFSGSIRRPEAQRAGAPEWPRSMAAMGDSITQAANVGYGDGDAGFFHSWATGRDRADPVISHYERILAADPSIAEAVHNDSVSGARMGDAPRQARRAVSQRVDYVTFLMGANDACTSSRWSMTSVRSFRRDFRRSIDTLVRGLPAALIYVVSIPDVYQLWKVLRDSPQARDAWAFFGTCGSLLSQRNDESDRLKVRRRVEDFNAVLDEVCAQYRQCFYDGGAVFSYRFGPEDVSAVDFFHPSITGQKHLAEVSWQHGPFSER
jgi:lysophospholipase L1-like esterase